jgi:hypothetical protein
MICQEPINCPVRVHMICSLEMDIMDTREVVFMKSTELLQEIRKMKFEETRMLDGCIGRPDVRCSLK